MAKMWKVLLVFLIIILIIAGSYLISYHTMPKECRDIKDNIEQTYCLQSKAIENKDISICNRMKNWGPEEITLFHSPIDYSQEKEECIREVGIFTGKLSYCYRIKGDDWTRDECITGVAVKTKDLTLCKRIGHTIQREICIKRIGLDYKNSSVCEQRVDSQTRDLCIMGVVESTEDLSTCELIKDLNIKKRCINYATAINEKNVSMCEFVDDFVLNNFCIYEIAVKLKDPSICDLMSFRYWEMEIGACKDFIDLEEYNYFEWIRQPFHGGVYDSDVHILIKDKGLFI